MTHHVTTGWVGGQAREEAEEGTEGEGEREGKGEVPLETVFKFERSRVEALSHSLSRALAFSLSPKSLKQLFVSIHTRLPASLTISLALSVCLSALVGVAPRLSPLPGGCCSVERPRACDHVRWPTRTETTAALSTVQGRVERGGREAVWWTGDDER